jgi:phage host-nuclease inhibitor protein Gam
LLCAAFDKGRWGILIFHFFKQTYFIMGKQRKAKVALPDWDAFNAAGAKIVELDAAIHKAEGKRAEALQRVYAEYSEPLAALTAEREDNRKLIEKYATVNKRVLFSEHKRSLWLGVVHAGFRISTPKIAYKKDWTEAKVLAALEKCFPEYVRTVQEVKKEEILKDRGVESLLDLLADCGIEVTQKDKFFCEVKVAEVPVSPLPKEE